MDRIPPRFLSHSIMAQSVTFAWDEAYIAKRGGYDKISKLIAIKEGQADRETKVKGFIARFTSAAARNCSTALTNAASAKRTRSASA